MTAASAIAPELELAAVIGDYVRSCQLTLANVRELRRMIAPALERCQYEEPETSAGRADGFQCSERATVYNLAAEIEICSCHHFRLERSR